MVRLRQPGSAQVLCEQGLFRATSALQLLSGLGKVFAEGLTGVIGVSEASGLLAADAASAGGSSFSGTECVSHVEVFISHTWGSPRWLKYLSMCLFLNIGLAVKAAVAAWSLAVSVLLLSKAERVLCGKEYLLPLLTELPVLIFFLFFFFGQHLSGGCWAPSFWLDKLCIHQTNEGLKAQQVAALPVFVARSAQMLVLWDDTYFERLWCNMEMATFAKYSSSPEKMKFLPLWLAPWLLSSLLLDLLGVNFLRFMDAYPGTEAAVQEALKLCQPLFGESPDMVTFLKSFWFNFSYFICYLPLALPTMLSFRSKIQGHRLMLQQMASFDLRNAKCSVEADRPLVEEQVALHFKPEIDTEVIVAGASGPDPQAVEAESSKDAALERFNSYVQGPLRANVLDCIGDTYDVSLPLCYVCIMPMATYYATTIFPFSFEGCAVQSVAGMGFSDVWQVMLSCELSWLVGQLLAYPITFPLLLRLLHRVEQVTEVWSLQLLLGLACSCAAYTYAFFCAGILWGCTTVVFQRPSTPWVGTYLLVLAFMMLQLWFFFGPRRPRSCGSCRCLEHRGGDDAKPMLELHSYHDGM